MREILLSLSPHWCPKFLPLSFLDRTIPELLGDTCNILLVTPAYKECMNTLLLEKMSPFIHPAPQMKVYSQKIGKTKNIYTAPFYSLTFFFFW